MTGWRIGWIKSHPSLGRTFENLVQYSTSGVAQFMQRAGIAALDQGDDFLREQVAQAERSRDTVCSILGETGRVRFAVPPGAFYLFFSVDGLKDSMQRRSTSSTTQMSAWRPGRRSATAGRDSLRLCFHRRVDKVEEAAHRLGEVDRRDIVSAVDGIASSPAPLRSRLVLQLRIPPLQRLFPRKRVGYDGVDVVELRLPAEFRPGALGIGDDRRRIARPPAADAHVEIVADDALHRVDHLQHRIALAVAAIGDQARSARSQPLQRKQVRLGQIPDVDVVAHTGAVGGRIVGAEDLHVRPLRCCGLAGDLDQVRRALGRLPGASLGIGAGQR